MTMRSLGIRASSKAIAAIGALALTFLTIPYIYVYENVVKLEASLQLRKSPSQVVWHTRANNLSSTVQSAYHQYQRLDFVQENLVSGPHQCGYWKCLFPLKTDPRIGYLVKAGSEGAEAMIDGFTASKNIIEEKYGMSHIYLAPPKLISVSLDFRSWMDGHGKLPGTYPGQKQFPHFITHSEIIVQAVATVPEEDSVMLGLNDPRRSNGLKGKEKMFTLNNNHESWNITDVEITVKRDFASLYRLVEVEDKNDDKLSCLCADFQIFLQRSGHLIHLDVERCFDTSGLMLMGMRCVPKLRELETSVLNMLQKSRFEQEQQRMKVISNHSSSPLNNESMFVRPQQP
eukprot:scaffold9773_cov151-Skeletonema_marinoi.AAC.10